MANINYIVSDYLDYEKLICNDAGPAYAKSMQWKVINLKSLSEFIADEVYVIDNRINEKECNLLTDYIQKNPEVTFIIKIVDPYFEHTDHYYYQWLNSIVTAQNIRLFSVYEPKELANQFARSLKKPMIYIPYPYDISKELPLNNLANRKTNIMISGAINSSIYPYRTLIWAKTRRSISRLFFSTLKHPGYQELNNIKPLHHFIAENFISYLSKYKFMLLCGSRCQIEFLKYQECAYAGCLPVGEAPTCFPIEIKSLFKTLNQKKIFLSVAKILLSWNAKHHIETVERYRAFFRTTRNPEILNQSFLHQLTSAKN